MGCGRSPRYDFDTPPESSRKIFEGVGYETVWQCCLDTFAVMNIPIRHSEKGWIRSHRTWHEDFSWQLNALVYPCPDTEAVTVLTYLETHRHGQLEIDFVLGGGAKTQLDLLEEEYLKGKVTDQDYRILRNHLEKEIREEEASSLRSKREQIRAALKEEVENKFLKVLAERIETVY